MIVLSRETGPVTAALTGRYSGVTVTLARLTSPQYAEANQAAQALLRDTPKLLELLARHDLQPAGAEGVRKAVTDPAFMVGIGQWIAAIECACRSVTAWTGVVDEDREPVEPSRSAFEVLCLDDGFSRQLMAEIDKAARVLVVEGKSSRTSLNGSAAPEQIASAPKAAATASGSERGALSASGLRTAGAVRATSKSSSRPRAPKSGV